MEYKVDQWKLCLLFIYQQSFTHCKFCRESQDLDVLGENFCDRLFQFDLHDTIDEYLTEYRESGCIIIFDSIIKLIEITGQKCWKIPTNISLPLGNRLVVRNTAIKYIDRGNLSSWHVKELDIVLNAQLEFIGAKAFADLRLERLRVFGNQRYRLEAESYEGMKLKSLELGVQGLSMGQVNKVIGVLPGLDSLDLSGNELSELKELKGGLKELKVSGCGLTAVDCQLFKGLPQLTSLELGHNNLDVESLERLLMAARSSNLTSLGLGNNLIDGDLFLLLLRLFSHLPTLRSLDLSHNHPISFSQIIYHLNASVPWNKLMPNVPSIRYLNCSVISFAGRPNVNLTEYFSNVEYLYLAYNMFSGSFQLSSEILKVLDLSWNTNLHWDAKFMVSPKDFENLPNLQVLNFTGSSIKELYNGSFQLAKKLKVLLLRQTSLTKVIDYTFSSNNKLIYLDLSGNDFRNPNSLSKMAFYGLSKLLALDLSDNQIFCLKVDLFEELKNLKYLSLKGNYLVQVTHSILQLNILEIVDISRNMLVGWNQQIFNNSPNLRSVFLDHNAIEHISPAMLEDFEKFEIVDLYENPLKCDCSMLIYFRDHLNRISANVSSVLIKFEQPAKVLKCNCGSVICSSLTDYISGNVYKAVCLSFPGLMIFVVCMMCFVPLTIAGALLYGNYKWEIKYFYYMGKARLALFKMKSEPDEEFSYDAFVSYCHRDRWFVRRLTAFLHQEHKLKLCVDDTDFMAGELIAEAVVSRMAVSRTALLVLSQEYLRSSWCRWELELARQRKTFFRKARPDCLVVIKLSQLDQSALSPSLKLLIKTSFCLQWDPHPCKQKIFWCQLVNAIKRSSN